MAQLSSCSWLSGICLHARCHLQKECMSRMSGSVVLSCQKVLMQHVGTAFPQPLVLILHPVAVSVFTSILAKRFVLIRFAYSSYKCLTCEVIMNGTKPEQEPFGPCCRIPFMNKKVGIPKEYHIQTCNAFCELYTNYVGTMWFMVWATKRGAVSAHALYRHATHMFISLTGCTSMTFAFTFKPLLP